MPLRAYYKADNFDKLFISPSTIKAGDGLIYPLSERLREEVVYVFTNKIGARVGADFEEADFFVTGKYFLEAKKVRFLLKLIDKKTGTVVKEADAEIKRQEIAHLLEPDLSFYALYLTSQLTQNLPLHVKQIRFLVSPLKFEDRPVYPPFSRYFLRELKQALGKIGSIEIASCEELQRRVRAMRQTTRGISLSNLRALPRGIGVNFHAHSLGAQLVRAYSLEGSFWRETKGIKVFVEVWDNRRNQISSASVVIPTHLVPSDWLEMEGPAFDEQPNIASELKVTIISDRSEGGVYHKGEEVSFILSANREGYFYIYDYNPAGEIVRLYPCEEEERNFKFQNAIMPAQGASWTIEPPFGVDRILVFATENPVPLPQPQAECGTPISLSLRELYQHYRQFQTSRGYAEAVTTIVTKE